MSERESRNRQHSIRKNAEVQTDEPQLPQQEVAKHVQDIINLVRNGVRQNPQFVKAAADHYTLSLGAKPVSYQTDNGRSTIEVFLEKRIYYSHIVESDPERRETEIKEWLNFQKQTSRLDGTTDTWRMESWSNYIEREPESGNITVIGEKENTSNAIQQAHDFFAAEFGEPQPQTQPQK
jgi:hypothetical protein